MALNTTNTLDRTNLGSAVSIIEDIKPGATLISPSNSPMLSSLNKVAARDTVHLFQIDDYSDPTLDSVAENDTGGDGGDAFGELGQYFVYLQKQRREFSVTRESQLVNNAVDVSFERALMKKVVELNRDNEKVIASSQARSAASAGTGAKAAGFGDMLSTGSSVYDGKYEVPSAQYVQTTAPSENEVNTVIDSIFNESGEVQDLRVYADSGWSTEFANECFRLDSAGSQEKLNVNIDGTAGECPLFITVFKGQHGMVKVMDTNPKCSADTTNLDQAFFINPNYAYIAELDGTLTEELPPMYGNRRGGVERIFAPVIENPRSCAFWESTS